MLAEVQTMLLSAFPAQMPSVLSDPSQASSSVQAAPPPSRHQTQHPAPALAPIQHASPASPAASKVELLEEQVRELEAQLSLAHAAAAAGASTVHSEEDPQEIEWGSHIQSRLQAPRSTTQPAKGRLVPPSSRASSHRGEPTDPTLMRLAASQQKDGVTPEIAALLLRKSTGFRPPASTSQACQSQCDHHVQALTGDPAPQTMGSAFINPLLWGVVGQRPTLTNKLQGGGQHSKKGGTSTWPR